MGSGLISTIQESGDKLIDYNKEDWIDMKQKGIIMGFPTLFQVRKRV